MNSAPALPLAGPTAQFICAWCAQPFGFLEAGRTGDGHGICPGCQSIYFPDLRQKQSAFIRARAEARVQQLDREIQVLDRQRLQKQTLQQSLIDEWELAR